MTHSLQGQTATTIFIDEIYSADDNSTFEFRGSRPSSISLNTGTDEMIRVAPDGFYVRGKKVPADAKEAETVYHAFKQWLTWANLQR